MFDNLSDRLSNSFKALQGKSKLSEDNIKDAIREVRRSLLEADVALEVIKTFIDQVQIKALGLKVGEGLTPSQAFIKLVESELTQIIGGENESLNLATQAPAVVMVAGLQGAGKTTSIAKLARFLKEREKKKVLVVSADVYRPAAIEQLKILAEQVEVDFFPSSISDKPEKIVAEAKKHAQRQFHDVLLVDTAGRLHIDEQMMAEIQALQQKVNPIETLFVVDSMTGQDAAHTAKAFADALPLTGIILTKTDGDARGGAALSMRYVTGKPIKFAGTGEKLDAIEAFDPKRVASRILGMGDVVSLVERAAETIKQDEAEALAKKMAQGKFDLEDLRMQLRQMQNMGGLGMLAGMLPGMKKAKAAMAASNMDDRVLLHMDAIIGSMTPKERKRPELLNAKRKKRVAAGSGTQVQDVNKVLKMHQEMSRAMKQIKKMGGLKGLGALFGGGGMGAAMPGLGGPGGMPGMGGAKGPGVDPSTLPPDLQDLLKKK